MWIVEIYKHGFYQRTETYSTASEAHGAAFDLMDKGYTAKVRKG